MAIYIVYNIDNLEKPRPRDPKLYPNLPPGWPTPQQDDDALRCLLPRWGRRGIGVISFQDPQRTLDALNEILAVERIPGANELKASSKKDVNGRGYWAFCIADGLKAPDGIKYTGLRDETKIRVSIAQGNVQNSSSVDWYRVINDQVTDFPVSADTYIVPCAEGAIANNTLEDKHADPLEWGQALRNISNNPMRFMDGVEKDDIGYVNRTRVSVVMWAPEHPFPLCQRIEPMTDYVIPRGINPETSIAFSREHWKGLLGVRIDPTSVLYHEMWHAFFVYTKYGFSSPPYRSEQWWVDVQENLWRWARGSTMFEPESPPIPCDGGLVLGAPAPALGPRADPAELRNRPARSTRHIGPLVPRPEVVPRSSLLKRPIRTDRSAELPATKSVLGAVSQATYHDHRGAGSPAFSSIRPRCCC